MVSKLSTIETFKYLDLDLEVYSINSLRDKLNSIVKNNFNKPIIIKAVISNKPKIYSDFVFFDIKDDKKNMYFTVLSNIYIYRKAEQKLKNLNIVDGFLEDVPVMLIVEPKVSTQKKIEFRLSLVDIIPEYTSSILKNKLEETINKLKEEALFDLQKKLKFPILPRNIAILSSDQGTSLKDIMAAMANSKRFVNIFFISVRVEGDKAATNIIDAINNLNKLNKIDLILLARGGGSIQDLSVFNDYNLCKAICKSLIPIICAIGHETDLLASELCSYLNPKPATPSGIGAFINKYYVNLINEFLKINNEIYSLIDNRLVYEFFKIKDKLIFIKHKIDTNSKNKIINFSNIINNINSYFVLNKKIFFKNNLDKIKTLFNSLILAFKKELNINSDRLKSTISIIEANNHKTILKKGYTFITSMHNKTIKSVKKTEKLMNLNFIDGSIKIQKLED